MSWSLSIPKQESLADFSVALDKAKERPKADGRTSVGKKQKKQVATAKTWLEKLAYDVGATSGSASGHVAPDLSGTISISVNTPAP